MVYADRDLNMEVTLGFADDISMIYAAGQTNR